MGITLDLCAAAYRAFCKKYKPRPKPERQCRWGSQKLAGMRIRLKAKKTSPGQKSLWDDWQLPINEIQAVAKTFVRANALNPELALLQWPDSEVASDLRLLEEVADLGEATDLTPPDTT